MGAHVHRCKCGFEWDCSEWACDQGPIQIHFLGKLDIIPYTCAVCVVNKSMVKAQKTRLKMLEDGTGRLLQ